MKKYEKEIYDPKQVELLSSDLSKNNDVIVETAGFVPLEVKFKQFEQNGIIAQFNSSEFTSSDYRDLYLNPDFDVTPEDDLEEIQEKKIAFMNYYKNKLIQKKQKNALQPIEKTKEIEKQKKDEKVTEE